MWLEQGTLVARIRMSFDLAVKDETVATADGADQVLATVTRFLADFTRRVGGSEEGQPARRPPL